MRTQIRSLASLSGLRIWHCCKLWCRLQTQPNPEVLWLWCRPAAIAQNGPLAWEPPCATGMRPHPQKKISQRYRVKQKFPSRHFSWASPVSQDQVPSWVCESVWSSQLSEKCFGAGTVPSQYKAMPNVWSDKHLLMWISGITRCSKESTLIMRGI